MFVHWREGISMKKTTGKRAACFAAALLTAVSLTVPAIQVRADERQQDHTKEELTAIAEGIVDWKKQEMGIRTEDALLSGSFLGQAGNSAGDWYPLAMGRLGLPDDYDSYLEALKANVEERYREKGGLHATKATEWQRIGLAVLSAGGDPTDFGTDDSGNSINLVADGSYDRGKTVPLNAQGTNGFIWGLLLMDGMRYEIPEQAADTRDTVIQGILENQSTDGGFSLISGDSAADMTAMAVQALAPYYNSPQVYTYTDAAGKETKKSVRQAVDEALECLSGQQKEDGNFGSEAGSETTSQVIIALCSLGIDPEKDDRFIKDGKSLLDGLLVFAQEDGGFLHTQEHDGDHPAASYGGSDSMAGEQALCALASVLRLKGDLRNLYDFRPEMEEGLKEKIRKLETGIDSLGTDTPDREQVETLFSEYLEIPVRERSYVSNYGKLADAMETLGLEDTSEELAQVMGENTSGAGTVTEVPGSGELSEQGEFTESDAAEYKSLPGEVSTEQYETVERLLEKLEGSENAGENADIARGLKRRKAYIEEIQAEIEAVNAEVLEKLYPLENISMSDRDEVHSILERVDRLEPYDRQQVLGYEDILRVEARMEKQYLAVVIGIVLGIVVLAAAGVILFRVKKRRGSR